MGHNVPEGINIDPLGQRRKIFTHVRNHGVFPARGRDGQAVLFQPFDEGHDSLGSFFVLATMRRLST